MRLYRLYHYENAIIARATIYWLHQALRPIFIPKIAVCPLAVPSILLVCLPLSAVHCATQELLGLIRTSFRELRGLGRSSRSPSLDEALDEGLRMMRFMDMQVRLHLCTSITETRGIRCVGPFTFTIKRPIQAKRARLRSSFSMCTTASSGRGERLLVTREWFVRRASIRIVQRDCPSTC